VRFEVKKVKLSLCYEDIQVIGVIAPPFVTLALDGGEWSASLPCCFTPQGKSPRYPLDRSLGGAHSWSGCFGVEKNLGPAGN
jgi:hypothetical protein